MIKQLLVIGLGGAIGSIFRYLFQLLISVVFTLVFPLGTFLVNLSGCFIIGLMYAALEKYASLGFEWRLFLITGLCGGYTTFSSFSFESLTLFKQGDYLYFFSYVILSVVFGL
ncbi:fluoride efflux transporter CrcB, partial [Arachidicoccus sp.]|uniref:fluoride efflux transporter CrcB n=1 Tax=Arachidicoccus sp. TaxID=1872624 RepID=UPI003D251A66